VPFVPQPNRTFVEFGHANSVVRGATGVAIEMQSDPRIIPVGVPGASASITAIANTGAATGRRGGAISAAGDKMGTGYANLWNAFKRINAGCLQIEKLALCRGTATGSTTSTYVGRRPIGPK
jgi:hypothetical protein